MLLQTVARVIAGIFSMLLFFCATLQYNDSDPQLWCLMYGISALVPLLVAFRRYSVRLLWLSLGLCAAGLAISIQGAFVYFSSYMNTDSLVQSMSPAKPYIEETREFLGALITIAVLLVSRYLGVCLARHTPEHH